MGLVKFNNCCLCFELKTGSFIIGYLSLIIAIIGAIWSVLIMFVGGFFMTVKLEDKSSQVAVNTVGTAALIIAVLLLISAVLDMALSILLLVGLHRNKPGLVKVFLIFTLIFLVIFIIEFLYKAISTPLADVIIPRVILLLLSIYFMLVIRSQYAVMRERSKRGPVNYSAALSRQPTTPMYPAPNQQTLA